MESYPQLIANKDNLGDPGLPQADRNPFALLLEGALHARDKVGLKMNIPRKKLDQLLEELPALRNPTVSQLTNPDWVAIETVIDEVIVRTIIPHLKEIGAEGIIEYPLNKVVY
jgi:ATP phosphoribosyltransferase